MRLKKTDTYASTMDSNDLVGVSFSAGKTLLAIMDFWDGGFNEGCLLIEKDNDTYVLWEYYVPFLTHDARVQRYKLTRIASMENLCNAVSAHCKKRFSGGENLDFSYLTQSETAHEYLQF